mmetsp:Transcript_15896/g.45496  ORF Transcript_15896/g.45496 Transcript_15896/m.45496 type:complete len:513 (-) Transcript_15896:105-1643(-)
MCDSSNCIHCQPHAQRFRHIVQYEFHGDEDRCVCTGAPTAGSPGGEPVHGVSRVGSCWTSGAGGSSGMPKRKATISSIWDFNRDDLGGEDRAVAGKGYREGYREAGAITRDMRNGNMGVVIAKDDSMDSSIDKGEDGNGRLASSQFSLLGSFRGAHAEHEIVGGLAWEPTYGCLLATAGVSKQVRIYSMATLGRGWEDASTRQDPIRLHRLGAKLTSLAWHPTRLGVVSIGDYDGCVMEIDLETGHILHEGDEHAGRRVWSVSYGLAGCLASASEDGTVSLWDDHVGSRGDAQNRGKSGKSDESRGVVARIVPGAVGVGTGPGRSKMPVTGVDMCQWNSNLLGLSSVDSCAYVYDLRNLACPLRTLRGHTRPVSYVKFYDQNTIVTAGIDSSLISWDLTRDRGCEREATYSAHSNNRHFAGLSVLPEEGLVSCGSENGRVWAYDKEDGGVLAYPCAKDGDLTSGRGRVDDRSVFCSAVAWRPLSATSGGGPVVAAALSDATIRICRLSKSVE